MSFDIFDYRATISEIDRTIAALNDRAIVLSRRRLDIAAMKTKEVMTEMIIDSQKELELINIDIEGLLAMKTKIRTLVELPTEIKDRLFAIYIMLGVKLSEYATRLPVCYEGMLLDIAPHLKNVDRDSARLKYKKYEMLPLPKYFVWVPSIGSIL